MEMFGGGVDHYLGPRMDVDRKDMVVFAVMSCVVKKAERGSPEVSKEGIADVDIMISTTELARMIRYANINFNALQDSDFDKAMGESSGAGVIFGATGGVIEAAVRTAYELQTKKPLPRLDYTELRGFEGIRSATIDFDGVAVNIGIAHGLANGRKLVEAVKAGRSPYHAIEIMACPGGCIGGGGQPYHKGDMDIIRQRHASIYAEDASKPIRKSHENPFIIDIYKNYFGAPCEHLAHELLHTTYEDRSIQVTPCSTSKSE